MGKGGIVIGRASPHRLLRQAPQLHSLLKEVFFSPFPPLHQSVLLSGCYSIRDLATFLGQGIPNTDVMAKKREWLVKLLIKERAALKFYKEHARLVLLRQLYWLLFLVPDPL